MEHEKQNSPAGGQLNTSRDPEKAKEDQIKQQQEAAAMAADPSILAGFLHWLPP